MKKKKIIIIHILSLIHVKIPFFKLIFVSNNRCTICFNYNVLNYHKLHFETEFLSHKNTEFDIHLIRFLLICVIEITTRMG